MTFKLSQNSNLEEFKSLLTGRWITDLANTSAFINQTMSDLNWVGFYLLEKDTLYLGPFQGLPACTEIKLGKGVCGTAAQAQTVLRVPDVHAFPGHIACDHRSRSELVIPLVHNSKVIGVLDLDSPSLNRFSQNDAEFLQNLVSILIECQKPESFA